MMKKIAIAALLSAFVATPALADNTGKAYIAADLGSASYSNTSPYPNPGMFRIAGGYHFSPMLAAELGYTGFGDSNVTVGALSGTLSASSVQIALVGSLPLNEKFDLIGKLGMANNTEKEVVSDGYSATNSQSSVLWGIGAQYHVNTQFSVRAQYEDYGNFNNWTSPMKATTFSLGVAYDF
jgi:OmpA-OmpF porin, OOP family